MARPRPSPSSNRAAAARHQAALPRPGLRGTPRRERRAGRDVRGGRGARAAGGEPTLRARVDRQLLAGEHNGREARYFVMTDVEGSPALSGPELAAHAPDNSFELLWAGAEDLPALGLHPAHLCVDLPRLLSL